MRVSVYLFVHVYTTLFPSWSNNNKKTINWPEMQQIVGNGDSGQWQLTRWLNQMLASALSRLFRCSCRSPGINRGK